MEKGHILYGEPPRPIWRVPDELWEKIEPILAEHDPAGRTGRPQVDQRAVLDAIIFRLGIG
jgi:transposase